MPTLDQLPPAQAAADTDDLMVSQSGNTRKISRADLLAGLQPQLALSAGSMLGRSSAGTGPAETIGVGANLVLANGTLSATAAPYAIGTLPAGQMPGAADRVGLAQGGKDASLPYAQFMAGLSNLVGIDASRLVATPTGGTAARPLADALADAVPVEAFGAKGDGVTDDSAALTSALASGRPLRFAPRTYIVNGQWTISTPAALFGARSQTVLKRTRQTGNGAWVSIQGASFAATGIIFDAGGPAVSQDSWGVLVTANCTQSEFTDCTFANAMGANLGHGLTILASDPAVTQHVVRNCELRGNAGHGLWVQAVAGVQILNSRAHDNARYGICLDNTDPGFVLKIRLSQVMGNRCWNNQRGISVGNFNATNTSPPVWGNANPDAIAILIAGNDCHDNAAYGIAAAGRSLAVDGNLLSNNGSTSNGGAGILANVAASRIACNLVTGTGQYGIDAGGSIDTDIASNHVAGAAVGINPGGSQRLRVTQNFVQDCGWAITVYNVETDGQGANFGQATNTVSITGNWISISGSTGGGIYLIDAPENVVVTGNHFVGLNGATASQALWAHTDSVVIRGNRWNNMQRLICNPVPAAGRQQIQFPDIADEIMVTVAAQGVQSMLGQHQAAMAGQIAFIKVTNGGSGYTRANVTITGTGTGAAAIAYIANGTVIGIAVTTPGTGYGETGSTASVAITGDGTGAAATAYVGLPVLEERRLRISCNCAVRFDRAGSNPLQDNWTSYDMTVPANSAVDWVGAWGTWRAMQFQAIDYVNPLGDGSLAVRTAGNGDLSLRPAGSGHVRVGSDAEPAGYITAVGRGSPQNVLVAPPGSDYRNLNGGVGSTYWVKQSGQDASGWVAVA